MFGAVHVYHCITVSPIVLYSVLFFSFSFSFFIFFYLYSTVTAQVKCFTHVTATWLYIQIDALYQI